MPPRIVHIVLCEGEAMLVLGGYWNKVHASVHARAVTGASPIAVEVLERLPDSVRELFFDDFDGDDTPVMNVIVDHEVCPTCDGAGCVPSRPAGASKDG